MYMRCDFVNANIKMNDLLLDNYLSIHCCQFKMHNLINQFYAVKFTHVHIVYNYLTFKRIIGIISAMKNTKVGSNYTVYVKERMSE